MLPPAIHRLARRQHGVIGRAQILKAQGVSEYRIEKLVAESALEPLHRGVYVVGGAPVTDQARIAAAVLAGGDGCVASHRAAAHLLKLGELELRVELSVPHGRRPEVRGATVHRTRVLPPGHVARALDIPVTTPARTLCDLAAVISGEELELALDHALVRRRVRCEYVRETLAALPRCKGRNTLAALLDARDDGRARVESVGSPGTELEFAL